MNSPLSLALVLILCLSNAAQRGFGKRNVTLDGVIHDLKELLQQAKDRKAISDAIMSILKNTSVANESSSDGPSITTQPVKTQLTTTNESQANISATTQPVTTQISTNGSQANISAATQPVTTQISTNGSQANISATTQPVTTQATTNKSQANISAKAQPVTTQTTTKESKTNISATTQPVATQTTTNKSQANISATTQPVTAETTINADTDINKKSSSLQLTHRSGNFPVFFMLILLIVVVGYFAYHNRTKIHRFIKEGYGKAKQKRISYLKVKLEDDIELSREANRQYVY